MANRKLRVLFKKIYPSGDIDTIFFKSRAKDVVVSEDGTQTMEDIATKVNGSAEGATKVEESNTNGNVKINGQEKTVYSHPNSGVTAGTYNSVTVDAKGHVTGATKVTDWTGTVSGDGSNETVAFSQASTRANIATGEKHSTMFGKIAKWFADLKSLAFVDSVGTANLDSTLTTFYNKRVTTDNVTESTSITEAGWIADARSIATLQNQINTINSNLSGKAPTSHVSSATTYGLGSASNYGHCKLANNLTTSSYANGIVLSAYQGYLLKQSIDKINTIRNNTHKHFTTNGNKILNVKIDYNGCGQVMCMLQYGTNLFIVTALIGELTSSLSSLVYTHKICTSSDYNYYKSFYAALPSDGIIRFKFEFNSAQSGDIWLMNPGMSITELSSTSS